jgi:2-polyprenyl-6-methoxyphenol hydroxylase-like FAD-dependent oxidoreductase
VNKDTKNTNWTSCQDCLGRGKKSRRIPKKIRLNYQLALIQFQKENNFGVEPNPPKAPLYPCSNCNGTGLVSTEKTSLIDIKNYPHVAIIGGGIGGVALAVACLHRGIPFTLFERDSHFEARSQGYGLTLQQASKAIEGLGIVTLEEGVISTRHLVHTTDGKVIAEWGIRKWLKTEKNTSNKRTNIHITRQSLRLALLEQLGGADAVQWGHQLVSIQESKNQEINLSFQVNGTLKNTKADLVVGADGIRSTVRKLLIGEETTPLQYLGCIVILGICSLDALEDQSSLLLDKATVFQTANGHERIYIMPFTSNSVMWQLSFPIDENEAKALSKKGQIALKKEACLRTQWHSPIPQILAATQENQITGYPVYDRELLQQELLSSIKNTTLIGDAAHPMSPFKGQGANQALLDALNLAREIAVKCKNATQWKSIGIRKSVLNDFETEMLKRSAIKVKDSADAAQFLHSEIVLHESDSPRGNCLKKK